MCAILNAYRGQPDLDPTSNRPMCQESDNPPFPLCLSRWSHNRRLAPYPEPFESLAVHTGQSFDQILVPVEMSFDFLGKGNLAEHFVIDRAIPVVQGQIDQNRNQ